MKTEIINKKIPIEMLIDTAVGPQKVLGIAIITNDRHGKTLSLTYGSRQMTIAFELVEKYLKS